jgi:hypothetical protein
MRGGNSNHLSNESRVESFKQEVASLHDYTLEEVNEALDRSMITDVYDYQSGQDISALLQRPIPWQEEYPEVAAKLQSNTSVYGDELEEELAQDPLIEELFKLENTKERGRLMRTRRTVLAYIFTYGAESNSADINDDNAA